MREVDGRWRGDKRGGDEKKRGENTRGWQKEIEKGKSGPKGKRGNDDRPEAKGAGTQRRKWCGWVGEWMSRKVRGARWD